jgi:hypothetical protein
MLGLTVSNDGQSVRQSAVLKVGASKQRSNALFQNQDTPTIFHEVMPSLLAGIG